MFETTCFAKWLFSFFAKKYGEKNMLLMCSTFENTKSVLNKILLIFDSIKNKND